MDRRAETHFDDARMTGLFKRTSSPYIPTARVSRGERRMVPVFFRALYMLKMSIRPEGETE